MSNYKQKALEFVKRRINGLLKEKDWTVYQLVKASGLSYSTLNNVITRDTLPGVDIITIVAETFGLSIEEFFNEDIRCKEPFELLSNDEKEIITLYSQLPESKKQRLKGYLECLVGR